MTRSTEFYWGSYPDFTEFFFSFLPFVRFMGRHRISIRETNDVRPAVERRKPKGKIKTKIKEKKLGKKKEKKLGTKRLALAVPWPRPRCRIPFVRSHWTADRTRKTKATR